MVMVVMWEHSIENFCSVSQKVSKKLVMLVMWDHAIENCCVVSKKSQKGGDGGDCGDVRIFH